jgi:short-subunit dehydrogenase
VDNLIGKTVVITGAANGLGKALALCLLKQGCNLGLIDIDNVNLNTLYKSIAGNQQKISLHLVDISVEANVQKVCAEVLTIHTTVDILINNAAISISQSFEQVDIKDYHRLMDVNFWGTVYCTRYFLPYLKHTKGALVNIVSDFALMGFPGKSTYSSSKAAIMAFTYCLKTELAETGVNISLVIPPPMNTRIVLNGKHSSAEKKQNEMLFLQKHGMQVDKAASRIVVKIKQGKFRIVVGRMMWGIDIMSRLFPTLTHKFIASQKDTFDFV